MQIELNEQQINIITELMLLGVKYNGAKVDHLMAAANIISYINATKINNEKAQEQQRKVKVEEKAK